MAAVMKSVGGRVGVSVGGSLLMQNANCVSLVWFIALHERLDVIRRCWQHEVFSLLGNVMHER